MKKRNFFGVVILGLCLTAAFSCKKEEAKPTNENNNQGEEFPIVATADVDYDGETNSYEFYADATLIGDSILEIEMENTNGNFPEDIAFMIVKKNDPIEEGDIFTFDSTQDEYIYEALSLCYLSNDDNVFYRCSNNSHEGSQTVYPSYIGNLEITKLVGNHLKCEFSFVLHETASGGSSTGTGVPEMIISNGKFDIKSLVYE